MKIDEKVALFMVYVMLAILFVGTSKVFNELRSEIRQLKEALKQQTTNSKP